MAKLMKDRTDNDIKNKWNATKRSQQRKHARLSPQVSSLSTETASLASLEQHWSNISPKKLAMTQPTDATITLSKQEDEEHITEV